ncbi:MAG TPA: hypothetical protein VLI39_17435 [Sedimentisphaerales bacterium]|nr:hypothetical protein [Sedimentisphaerales bacterium]
METEDLEKYSSAVTLSDMELFVFPELIYSLVLANIMSPVIWKWRQHESFQKLAGKSSYRRLMRMRQFIMDEFDFNLDLETWGLTNQATEIKRFERCLSPQQIAASNALFGYEGDKYYYDVDIRRHFGLDKYTTDIIPYWKTETVEAMDAFRLKPGYGKAAGECVSLATLYAAAAFIVCGVPLEDIFMVLTPLHSQNFIDLQDGILTNNRRLVTKTMWFNGTEISNKAQRALRNEQVTVVAHNTGVIHCLYDDATIDPKAYEHFKTCLAGYLSTGLDVTVFASFLRSETRYQKYFQLCRDCHGQPRFIRAELLYSYEHGSPFKIGDDTHDKLLAEVADEDFVRFELPGRIRCDRLCDLLKQKIDVRRAEGREAMRRFLEPTIPEAGKLVDDLLDFVHMEARLPESSKNFTNSQTIRISPDWTRDQIIDYLRGIRSQNATADLAFYAYRDMESCDWRPFLKAAIERSPISLEKTKEMSVPQVYDWLQAMPAGSIYDGNRLAQPDELANYLTGDGLEKAILLANILRHRNPDQELHLEVDNRSILLRADRDYEFTSAKTLQGQVDISPEGRINVVAQSCPAKGHPRPWR